MNFILTCAGILFDSLQKIVGQMAKSVLEVCLYGANPFLNIGNLAYIGGKSLCKNLQ